MTELWKYTIRQGGKIVARGQGSLAFCERTASNAANQYVEDGPVQVSVELVKRSKKR